MSYTQKYLEKQKQRRAAPVAFPWKIETPKPAEDPPTPLPETNQVAQNLPEWFFDDHPESYPAGYQLIDGISSSVRRQTELQRIAALSREEIKAELRHHREVAGLAMEKQSEKPNDENFRYWASAQYYIRFCEKTLTERN